MGVHEGVRRLYEWLRESAPPRKKAAAVAVAAKPPPTPTPTPGRKVWGDDAKTTPAADRPPGAGRNGGPRRREAM